MHEELITLWKIVRIKSRTRLPEQLTLDVRGEVPCNHLVEHLAHLVGDRRYERGLGVCSYAGLIVYELLSLIVLLEARQKLDDIGVL